ncbi:hypothetical protein C8R45DRAFT_932858 [Mycena sanguinolenta]|nr:hypothetical protein C8R45DRAFT_932858 [Mycena sanguinolenta]
MSKWEAESGTTQLVDFQFLLPDQPAATARSDAKLSDGLHKLGIEQGMRNYVGHKPRKPRAQVQFLPWWWSYWYYQPFFTAPLPIEASPSAALHTSMRKVRLVMHAHCVDVLFATPVPGQVPREDGAAAPLSSRYSAISDITPMTTIGRSRVALDSPVLGCGSSAVWSPYSSVAPFVSASPTSARLRASAAPCPSTEAGPRRRETRDGLLQGKAEPVDHGLMHDNALRAHADLPRARERADGALHHGELKIRVRVVEHPSKTGALTSWVMVGESSRGVYRALRAQGSGVSEDATDVTATARTELGPHREETTRI